METLYITHPECRLHDMGSWHPESPQRLDAIGDQLLSSGMMPHLAECEADVAGMNDILRVHAPEYLAFLQNQAPRHGYRSLDDDTAMNPCTLPAAWAAAGAGITAVDAIMRGKAETAFCAVRPPGHHARPSQAMGFCFFNNIAIAAAYALEKHGLRRVAIIDFDVHHGNGTEEMFEHDDRVLMCSFFQHPLFPSTLRDTGASNMVNVPVPANTPPEALRAIVAEQWMPRLKAFAPEMLFISAGFDAHLEDDMGQLGLTEADYAWITRQLVQLAAESAQGRVVSMLEGGYNLSALGRSVVAHIRALSKM
ncbi:histone deacetylase family protein [Paracandidimonas soli]|uniref:Acetoin utilization deacetylase AcuC-like enzyme n=1 Tax=Paracandidimonas soli TaxID=1917182 RepID=A0A4R3UR05_9BURK|nr:histone deacetylase family protein [Paracandidimonas soli]TCU93023.1 acetoin utilization deacetylase AcuC-like enzyme [Paracandidimonas soli]